MNKVDITKYKDMYSINKEGGITNFNSMTFKDALKYYRKEGKGTKYYDLFLNVIHDILVSYVGQFPFIRVKDYQLDNSKIKSIEKTILSPTGQYVIDKSEKRTFTDKQVDLMIKAIEIGVDYRWLIHPRATEDETELMFNRIKENIDIFSNADYFDYNERFVFYVQKALLFNRNVRPYFNHVHHDINFIVMLYSKGYDIIEEDSGFYTKDDIATIMKDGVEISKIKIGHVKSDCFKLLTSLDGEGVSIEQYIAEPKVCTDDNYVFIQLHRKLVEKYGDIDIKLISSLNLDLCKKWNINFNEMCNSIDKQIENIEESLNCLNSIKNIIEYNRYN